ncbi:MAG TPA: questin oxidase family protein [Candidatus Tectomicrobia bacterium]|nr:questin oxidase family protein [Candidatus Tectomicrobia bacterium]
MAATIDEALDILHRTGPDLVNGNSNHGPMVAEALCVLGRSDAVIPWLEGYKNRFQDRPQTRARIAPEDWQQALGEPGRSADWVEFFERQMADAPWQTVLQVWVPHLAAGLMAAATHGLIRTGHAVRSLSAGETPQRLHELAEGLGYWAASYQVLPGRPSGGPGRHAPHEAVRYVGRIHGPGFDPRGAIVQQVKGLDDHQEFVTAIDLVDTADDLSRYISDLTETFAGVYLANPTGLIAFVHAVTAPSALRLLLPYLTDADARLAARYAWQACAGIYAWYSTRPPPAPSGFMPPPETPEALIDRAVAAGGAHTIKFTEACLREYALNPQPVYLAAARDAADRVGRV